MRLVKQIQVILGRKIGQVKYQMVIVGEEVDDKRGTKDSYKPPNTLLYKISSSCVSASRLVLGLPALCGEIKQMLVIPGLVNDLKSEDGKLTLLLLLALLILTSGHFPIDF